MAELGVHQSALLTDLALCINRYRLFSPGWYVCVMAKVQLSAEEWERTIGSSNPMTTEFSEAKRCPTCGSR